MSFGRDSKSCGNASLSKKLERKEVKEFGKLFAVAISHVAMMPSFSNGGNCANISRESPEIVRPRKEEGKQEAGQSYEALFTFSFVRFGGKYLFTYSDTDPTSSRQVKRVNADKCTSALFPKLAVRSVRLHI
jgi:hypothetical protein